MRLNFSISGDIFANSYTNTVNKGSAIVSSSKRCPQASSFSILWELVRDATSGAPLQIYWIRICIWADPRWLLGTSHLRRTIICDVLVKVLPIKRPQPPWVEQKETCIEGTTWESGAREQNSQGWRGTFGPATAATLTIPGAEGTWRGSSAIWVHSALEPLRRSCPRGADFKEEAATLETSPK